MKFDKSKILTVVTADQAKVGQKGWFSDNLMDLEAQIKSNSPKGVISEIYTRRAPNRFVDEDMIAWNLFYPVPAPTHAERQAEWVKKNGVKVGTRIRITKDYGEDFDARTIEHTGVAGRCGSVGFVGNSYINVYLDSEEFHFLTVPYYAMEVIKESKQTYEPITGFEAGKWYVCHLSERPISWNSSMDGLLDGKPHKCIMGNETFAEFEGMPLRGVVSWSFRSTMDYFEEVPSPVKSYSERQAEWVKENNVKVGTKFRFTKGFEDMADGSDCCEHRDAKGVEGYIKGVKDTYLYVDVGGDSWAVTFTALEVIKEPTYRPYNNDELNDLVGEVLTNKKSGRRKLVTGKPTELLGVNLDGSYITAKDLLSSFYRNTNEPCGIKE